MLYAIKSYLWQLNLLFTESYYERRQESKQEANKDNPSYHCSNGRRKRVVTIAEKKDWQNSNNHHQGWSKSILEKIPERTGVVEAT